MAGRKLFFSLSKMYVFYFIIDTRVLKWAHGEPITPFALHPALSGVTRGTLEAACGVVRQE